MRASQTEKLCRSDFACFYPIQTRWGDNDLYGHVNNVTYYAYFDSVINRFLIERGGLDIHQGNVIGFIVASQCAYFKPVAYPEQLECGLRVTRIGHSSVDYQLGLFWHNDNLLRAQGSLTHVFVDRETHKPVAVSGQLHDGLAAISRSLIDTL
ncbi:acyl-CoA thioesterase [Alteromonas oceanisediminis]|uniref:acyl-CoA thioesterase n=1 Tax=Alteromonas oceanisediminis TaxID=2836180 RepID=UPI001BD964F6|nr:thioesterase family protein [Alteromonas oceanisediminis]MBT0587366.1 acyl-CoA thioesterase [Alteromonas oceanisediminis]